MIAVEIRSPGFPLQYFSAKNCKWHVNNHLYDSGLNKIKLVYNSFHIPTVEPLWAIYFAITPLFLAILKGFGYLNVTIGDRNSKIYAGGKDNDIEYVRVWRCIMVPCKKCE